MLSLYNELDKFPPVDINMLEERDGKLPDYIKNSIVLYNKAIGNIRAHNEDIAIIELKKAISFNPHFFEAMNLLGLCYQFEKEYDKADELFKKVIAAENNSVKALEYIKFRDGINQDTSKQLSKPSAKKSVQTAKTSVITNKKESATKFNSKIQNIQFIKNDIFKYVIGFGAGIIFLFAIQIPFKKADNIVKTNSDISTTTPAPTAKNEFESKYNALNEEYKKLKTDYDKVNSELQYYTSISRLEEAERLAAERKYEEAADLLVLLRDFGFKDQEKEKFDKLLNDILPRATWAVYLQGENFFNTQNYKDAVAKFIKVQAYGGNWDYMPVSLYNMGRSYAALNDKAKAVESFKKLKEKYPNSEYAKYADTRIAELGG